MSENLFPDNPHLDTEYLNDTYGDDPETAIMMFEDYLGDLPLKLKVLEESYINKDIETFRELIHKQKASYSYVGLTDVSESFHDLETRCQQVSDLATYQQEIDQSLTRIKSATPVIKEMLFHLQQF